jgi:putative addiction module component (TIGR02574 family)
MSELMPTFDIQNLEPTQKLDLIGQLWDSLPDCTDSIPMSEWHQRELDNRLAAADASPKSAIPWDAIRQRLRKIK